MAGPFFVDDGGDNSDGLTWEKAFTSFLGGVNALTAGDEIIYIGADHAESPGVQTYNFPSSSGAPNIVISSTVGSGTTVVYDEADNIQVTASAITMTGHVRLYGVSFASAGDLVFNDSDLHFVFVDSKLEITGHVNDNVLLGSNNARACLHLINTDFGYSHVTGATSSGIRPSGGNFIWEGGTFNYAGSTMPTALFETLARTNVIQLSGVDLSALTSALVKVSDSSHIIFEAHHCLLDSGVSLDTGTISFAASKLLMSGCDDTTGNGDLYRLDYVDYYGRVTHDDTIFVTTGAASDGTTPISWKMVTTANAAEFHEALISPPIDIWIDSAASKTLTIQCNWDSATTIQNDEIWMEVEYLSASADTESDIDRADGMANPLATPANQTTNATAWDGDGGFTNQESFALNTTITLGRVGSARCRVHLAKPSTTVYVDPKVTVT